MSKKIEANIAIVDYGMGNLFSVKRACEWLGADAVITHEKSEILNADAVVLPGVGAFGDAMDTLKKLDLIKVLQEVAASAKPLVGICLGMQLLMSEGHEFGHHQGLNIIKGEVVPFENSRDKSGRLLKVPQIGWNHIYKSNGNGRNAWQNSILKDLPDNEFMYFVHSYYVKPKDENVCLSKTRYGPIEFCSSFQQKNIFACQFHPERSGRQGLKMYENLLSGLKK